MSRKGRIPIPLPKGVEFKIDGEIIHVKGPKGSLSQKSLKGLSYQVTGEHVHVSLVKGAEELSNFHGLYRALVANMIHGVHKGFEKNLEMIGVGFRANVSSNVIELQVGFSNPVKVLVPEGLLVKVEKGTQICISGIDKQKVGQFAADIRSLRPPEPYKGKGIRYKDEYVRRKAGKTAKK
ncbi:MAG: 50S ribosomal protein L6 [Chlamydiia bacterium]|nr:50S ribosomal protein L6 [Chlamydiia bacterium]